MRGVAACPVCPVYPGPDAQLPLADQLLCGMAVEAGEEDPPHWRWVRTAYRYEGYVPARCLRLGREAEEWAAGAKRVARHRDFTPVMARPSFRSRLLTTLPLGALVVPTGEETEDWQGVELPDGSRGYVRSGWLDGPPQRPEALAPEALRRRLVDAALCYRRAPYLWGGKTPLGVDCSGLVSMAYLLNGIVICRDARLEPGFDLAEVPREAMAPGDALFFPGHVALYLGEGRYLHATGKAGSDGVDVNSLDPADPAYRPDLAQALAAVGSYKGFHR